MISKSRIVLSVVLAALVSVGVVGVSSGGDGQTRLVSSGSTLDDQFGKAVALSGDTAVVSAPSETFTGGTVYVFARDTGGWAQQQRITGIGFLYSFPGTAPVAVSGDTFAAGTVELAGLSDQRGSAYVFTRSGSTWTQQQRVAPDGGTLNDNFGARVALEGDTLVVTADASGSAYVFVRSAGVWTQQQRLSGSTSAGFTSFATSVALSGDTIALGGGFPGGSGAIEVFVRSSGVWTSQAVLLSSDGAFAQTFGESVALQGDVVIAGSSFDAQDEAGTAFVFRRHPGTQTWTQEARLRPADGSASDRFGAAVAVTGDTAIVTAPERFGVLVREGSAYVFKRSEGVWTERSRCAASDATTHSSFGSSVSVDGETYVVGTGRDDEFDVVGKAYVQNTSGGEAPTGNAATSFVVPLKVSWRPNQQRLDRSRMFVKGVLDTGPTPQQLGGSATLVLRGLLLEIPSFQRRGRSFVHSSSAVSLKVTPSSTGSSRAKFKVLYRGYLPEGGPDGPFEVRFVSGSADATAEVDLASGKFKLGKVAGTLSDPPLYVRVARAGIRGEGRDSLALVLGLGGNDPVPAAPEALTVQVGDGPSFRVPASGFERSGSRDVFSGNADGIRRVTIDHAKGTVSIRGSGLTLGEFEQGASPVKITVTRGTRIESVRVRLVRRGQTLGY